MVALRNRHRAMGFPTTASRSVPELPDEVVIASRRTLTIHELMLDCSAFAAVTTAA